MAAPDSSVSRLGQVNGTGADDALFLKQFGGEILTEFQKSTVFHSRHFVRQITNGKTAQFPLIGTVSGSYHTAGKWIDGQVVDHAETLISVDGLLIAPVFIASIDELMNHYDVRGPYATEMGRELAQIFDTNVARTFIKAARATSPLTGRSGGSSITDAAMATDSTKLVAALFSAAQILDEKNIASEDRNGFFRPAQYYLLAQNETLLNKQFSGNANISSGTVETTANITLVKTNNVPSTDQTDDTTINTKYRDDYSNTVGIVGNRWAAGTVQLMDISLDSEFEIRNQGTFMLAKMAVGHDVLRTDCAIEVAVTSS